MSNQERRMQTSLYSHSFFPMAPPPPPTSSHEQFYLLSRALIFIWAINGADGGLRLALAASSRRRVCKHGAAWCRAPWPRPSPLRRTTHHDPHLFYDVTPALCALLNHAIKSPSWRDFWRGVRDILHVILVGRSACALCYRRGRHLHTTSKYRGVWIRHDTAILREDDN